MLMGEKVRLVNYDNYEELIEMIDYCRVGVTEGHEGEGEGGIDGR